MNNCVKIIYYVEYFTAWGKEEKLKTITFKDAKKLNSEVLRTNRIGFNEIIKVSDGFVRFAGDIDNDQDDSDALISFMDSFIEVLQELEKTKLGRVALGGYTKCQELLDYYPCLEFIPEGHHAISLHFSFPDSCLSIETYKIILSKANKLFRDELVLSENNKKQHVYTLGNLDCLDGNVYNFRNTKQLMRAVISDKYVYENKIEFKTAASKVFDTHNNVLEDWTDCLFTCNGNEIELSLDDLSEAGLYMENPNASLDYFKPTKINSDTDVKEVSKKYNNLNEQLLQTILNKVFKESGDKDMELANKVSGNSSIGLKNVISLEAGVEIIYNWWNTDHEGKEWKHQAEHYADNLFKNYYLHGNLDFIDIQDNEEKAWNSLICLVSNEQDKESLKHLYNKLKQKLFSIEAEYESLDDIKHYTIKEIQHLSNRSLKLQAVAQATRFYSNSKKSCFLSFIHSSDYYIKELDEEDFKKNVLETIFHKGEEVNKVVDEIKHKCVLNDSKREMKAGIPIKYIYKNNPLANIEDKCPETKDKHIEAYKERLLKGSCNNNEEAYEFMLKRQAWIVQNVMKPCPIIEMAVGANGTGKTFDSEMFALILDDRETVDVKNPSEVANTNTMFVNTGIKLVDVVGKFTPQTARARFLNINELSNVEESKNNTHDDYQNLKACTDVQRRIEAKGKDAGFIQNTISLNVTSNNYNCIKPDLHERRFFVHGVNASYNDKNVKYWKDLRTIYSEPYFFKHIYDYLANLDLTDFNIHSYPLTKDLVRLLVENAPYVDKFILENYELLADGMTKDEIINLIETQRCLGSYKNTNTFFSALVTKYGDGTEFKEELDYRIESDKVIEKRSKKQLFKFNKAMLEKVKEIKEKYDESFGKQEEDFDEEEIQTTKIEAVNKDLEEAFNWIKKEAIKHENRVKSIYYLDNEKLKEVKNIKEIECLLMNSSWEKADLQMKIEGKKKHFRNTWQISSKAFDEWEFNELKVQQPEENSKEAARKARKSKLEKLRKELEDLEKEEEEEPKEPFADASNPRNTPRKTT